MNDVVDFRFGGGERREHHRVVAGGAARPAAAGAGAGGVADGAQRDPAEQAVLLEAYRALAREAFPDLPDLVFSGGDFATLQRDLALARAAWQQGKQAAVRD
ncbi:MAG: hypothetical protein ACK40O_10040, partial [Allosphingosinicella sp.]